MGDVLISQFYIKLDGTDVSTAFMSSLHGIDVDLSLFMPAMATVELMDEELTWVDDARLKVGAEIEISATGTAQVTQQAPPPAVLFKGRISSIEPVYLANALPVVTIRAYDKLHAMHRGTGTKTFLNSTDSDIARKLISEAGLSATVQSTQSVHKHVFRGDLSSYDFLQALARRNGYVTYCDGSRVHWKPATALNFPTVTVRYGEDLIEFRPVLSMSGQVNEVMVQGWDPAAKAAVTATVTAPTFNPTSTGFGSRGPVLARTGYAAAAKLHVSDHLQQQAVAQTLANATFDRLAAADMTAEGTLFGNTAIKPGGKVKVEDVGRRFNGTYMVSRVRHTYSPKGMFETHFWLGGMSSGTVGALLNDDPADIRSRSPIAQGVAVGIVTNNNDQEGDTGRVKVKFPWLSDSDESAWAPVLGIGAGNQRGFYVLPEVNDEVLVAFANGDFNQPYVLGGVWNGKDKPPQPVGQAVSSSGVEVREFKTRVGHVLRFTDKAGSEKIELIDKTKKNSIVIEAAANKITITADGPILVESKQDVKLKGPTVTVEAETKLALKGATVDINGSGSVKISGPMVQIN